MGHSMARIPLKCDSRHTGWQGLDRRGLATGLLPLVEVTEISH
jgi:hypothetical protein